jgi:hypothetical protein
MGSKARAEHIFSAVHPGAGDSIGYRNGLYLNGELSNRDNWAEDRPPNRSFQFREFRSKINPHPAVTTRP